MRTLFVVFIAAAAIALPVLAQEEQPVMPKTAVESVQRVFQMVDNQFTSLADAMPEDKYSFAPSQGAFQGARTFAEQVKHVACGNFAFFNEVEGKKPPEHCDKGGPDPAKTKPELMKYLRDSFAYAERVMETITSHTELDRVEGPYGGPTTKAGIAALALWHATDHYGQLVEYARMNGVVPPASR
jgi:uncharacterized damage-inducible protein DinB